LLLHPRSLFHEFSDAGHNWVWDFGSGIWVMSGADFDNLAFEYFQRLLNERIVLEIAFVEGGGC
jgi:hypothetical protein